MKAHNLLTTLQRKYPRYNAKYFSGILMFSLVGSNTVHGQVCDPSAAQAAWNNSSAVHSCTLVQVLPCDPSNGGICADACSPGSAICALSASCYPGNPPPDNPVPASGCYTVEQIGTLWNNQGALDLGTTSASKAKKLKKSPSEKITPNKSPLKSKERN